MRPEPVSLLLCCWAGLASAEQGRLSASLIEATPERAIAEGDVDLRWSGHRFLAERLVVEEGDGDELVFQAIRFEWTPCGCETPPWSISAAQAEGVLDDHMVMRRGVFRVCDVPVLPLPWLRLPLSERAPRLLLPELRVGEEGTVVGQPVWLPIGRRGHAVLTPQWWSQRWLRQRVQIEAPLGEADVALSKDAVGAPARGQADIRGGHDDGQVRAAMDVGWVSDADVRADYGAGFFERSTMYEERLLVAGIGPARLESDTFDGTHRQRPISAVASLGSVAIGASSLGAYARVDTLQTAHTMGQQAAAGATWSAGYGHKWVDLEAVGRIDAVQGEDTQPYVRTGIGAAAMVPTWADIGEHRVVSQTGIEGWIDADEGTLDDPFGLTTVRPRWALGPGQRSHWVSAAGVPLRWSGAVLWTSWGLRPQGVLNINDGGLSGTVHADPEVQGGVVGHVGEGMDAQAGVLRDEALLQGILRTSVLVASHWRPGWSGLYDFKTERFVRHGPNLVWDPGCGCVTANIAVEWAQDTALPSVMLRLDLHARRPADR